jgi:hypothetical protein
MDGLDGCSGIALFDFDHDTFLIAGRPRRALIRCLIVALAFAFFNVSGSARSSAPVPQQDQAGAARAAAGCGPSNFEFDVKTDNKQHPMPLPEPGKSLVYFLRVETQAGGAIKNGWVTSRVGIDGAWVGANHGKSYFFFSVNPGEHAVCVDWQSKLKIYSRQSAALTVNMEQGKVYYIRTNVKEITEHEKNPSMELDLIDAAEGNLLISSSALSAAHPKK